MSSQFSVRVVVALLSHLRQAGPVSLPSTGVFEVESCFADQAVCELGGAATSSSQVLGLQVCVITRPFKIKFS